MSAASSSPSHPTFALDLSLDITVMVRVVILHVDGDGILQNSRPVSAHLNERILERILDDGLRRRRHVRWTAFVQIPVSVEASRAEERGSAKLHFRYRSIGVVGIEANAILAQAAIALLLCASG